MIKQERKEQHAPLTVTRVILVANRMLLLLALGGWFGLPALAGEFIATPAATAPKARIVTVQNPQATEAFTPRAEVLQAMMDRAITALTGQPEAAAAWRSLVSTQDVVGIKVVAAPGATAGTRPAVVAAVVQGLLAAKLPPRNIIIWDRRLMDLRSAGYDELVTRFGVRLAGCLDSGYDDKVFYESPLLGTLLSGDLEFNSPVEKLGRKSHVSRLLSQEVTKIINVSPLLNSYATGVSGNLASLALGSVDNTRRFESSTDALTRAVPEIYALPALSDHVVLNITDALICQFEGGETVRLHNAAVLNEIRVSRDPVALDVLSTRELADRRRLAGFPPAETNWFGLYENAALLELGVSDVKKIQVDELK